MNSPCPSPLQLRPLTEEELCLAFADIRAQFPPEEIKTESYYRELLEKTTFSLLGAFVGDLFVGYIAFVPLSGGIFWLDVLGIFPAYQSKGYGQDVLLALLRLPTTELQRLYGSSSSSCPQAVAFILLEVEKPDPAEPLTLRRIAFYERLGAYRLSDSYILPNEDGGCPLDLWCLPQVAYLTPLTEAPQPSVPLILNAIQEAWQVIHTDIKELPPLPSSFLSAAH